MSTALAPSSRFMTLAGLVFALGWPIVLAVLQPNQNLADINQDIAVVVIEWVAVAILFAIVSFGEKLPFAFSVGLVAPQRADWFIVGFLVLVAVAACVVMAIAAPTISSKNTILAQAMAVSFVLRALLVFTAGVCEEICFRGYAIERLSALTRRPWIAALIATVLFTLGHIPRYGLSSGLAEVFVIGAALSMIYVWRRNLAACIVLHWIIDGMGLLIVPAFAALK